MNQATKNVVSSENRWLHIAARALTVVVAVAAAVLSFDALTQLAVAAGISPQLGWIWAVLVDGFILIATISVFALRKRSRGALAWAFFILGLFVAISIVGNGLHPILRADELNLSGTPELEGGGLPFWAATLVTAVPPVALFLAIHLITVMITPSKEQEKVLVREEAKAEREQTKPAPTRKAHVSLPTPLKPATERHLIDLPQPAQITATPTVPASVSAETEAVEDSDLEAEGDVSAREKELLARMLAGESFTGQQAADFLGVKLRTAQNKLKKIREELGVA